MSPCYVWKPKKYRKIDRNHRTERGSFGAMIFKYQKEWWIFVEPREGHSLNDCVPNGMQTSGPVFDYGRALWELSK